MAILLVISVLAAGARAQSPSLFDSVGRLLVPSQRLEDGYRRHYREHCSATLVAAPGAARSRWVLTAWHCLEHYRDLSRDIVFEHASGQRLRATRVVSGGAMYADWALLRLVDDLPDPVPLAARPAGEESTLLMVGYSREPSASADTAGARQAPLSWDAQCRLTGRDGHDLLSNCQARKGASGGAVFSTGDEPRYLGVVSRGDSATLSIFVPLSRILPRINPYLRQDRASVPGHP